MRNNKKNQQLKNVEPVLKRIEELKNLLRLNKLRCFLNTDVCSTLVNYFVNVLKRTLSLTVNY